MHTVFQCRLHSALSVAFVRGLGKSGEKKGKERDFPNYPSPNPLITPPPPPLPAPATQATACVRKQKASEQHPQRKRKIKSSWNAEFFWFSYAWLPRARSCTRACSAYKLAL